MKLNKITIESITESQLNKLFSWNNDPEITKFFKSKNKTMDRIKIGLAYPGAFHFMINESEEDIGYIFYTKSDDGAYVTVTIDKIHWGRGFAREAMTLLEEEGRKSDVKKFKIEVYPENIRAINLYKYLGYIEIGEIEGRVVMEKVL